MILFSKFGKLKFFFLILTKNKKPEKIRLTDKGYSIKSDIWSLGISLIEISTGTHPFSTVKGVYELTTIILEAESPKLDSDKFSRQFCSFVDKW